MACLPNCCCCLVLCAVGEDDLRHSLGLATCTTGKGKVQLDANTRALEVFMCSVVSACVCCEVTGSEQSPAACGRMGACRDECHVPHEVSAVATSFHKLLCTLCFVSPGTGLMLAVKVDASLLLLLTAVFAPLCLRADVLAGQAHGLW